jgi:hypothetical protein
MNNPGFSAASALILLNRAGFSQRQFDYTKT